MKITKKILQNIIKEEIEKVLEQKLDSEKSHGSKRFGTADQTDVGTTTALAKDQDTKESKIPAEMQAAFDASEDQLQHLLELISDIYDRLESTASAI